MHIRPKSRQTIKTLSLCAGSGGKGAVSGLNTVDRERFAGLNIRGFNAIEVFVEIFSRCLGHKQCVSTHYLGEAFIFTEKLSRYS